MQFLWVALIGLGLIVSVVGAGHALLHKREPRAATLWVAACLVMPVVGVLLYVGFGVNRVRRRAQKVKAGRQNVRATTARWAQAEHRAAVVDHATASLARLRKLADRDTERPLYIGNRVEMFCDGQNAYPRMLQAIADARKNVTLCTFIYDWDATGQALAEALGMAARRGAKVWVLADAVGTRSTTLANIRDQLPADFGCVEAFFPVRWPLGPGPINLRNHRKLLVVDGQVGFTGGMNISSRYRTDNPFPHDPVQDVNFRVTGPVVAQMQQAFVEDWFLATGDVLDDAELFQSLSDVGPAVARGISSGPDEDLEKLYWIILGALTAAHRRVRIVTPYFIPDRTLIRALCVCAMRGVQVQVVLPERLDHPFIGWATVAFLWEILEHDCQVYYQPAPFVHAKLMTVDGQWLLFGSANVDPRSLRLNFEFNIEVYDPDLARQADEHIDGCIARSRRPTMAELDALSLPVRLRNKFARLFAPYL
jgi:cardiolipin synthase